LLICLTCIYCVLHGLVAVGYIYSYLFYPYKDYCHRVTTQLQLVMMIILIIMNTCIMSRFRRIISYDNIHVPPHLSSGCRLSPLAQQTNRYFMQHLTKGDRNVLSSVLTFHINITQKCVISGFHLGVIASPFCDVTQPTMASTEFSRHLFVPFKGSRNRSLSWTA
jgi:hypothetical protein